MIVSDTSNRSSSRLLRACGLLCAFVVLPVGLTFAQNYAAVEKRLGEAVSMGELSLDHAGVMMDALRRAAEDDDDGIGDRLKAAGARLKASVRGSITPGSHQNGKKTNPRHLLLCTLCSPLCS